MTFIEGIVQGLIQGFTEFLPVSSSGHLSVYQYITGNSSTESALFSLFLHGGTLIAVFVAFWHSIFPLILEVFDTIGDIFTGRFHPTKPNSRQRMIYMLLLATLPLLSALVLKDLYRSVSSDHSIILEGICFLLTALLLRTADHCGSGYLDESTTPYWTAFIIGVAQAIAPLPGISRSGSTLAVAMILGLSLEFALNFSFILGIPAILGAIVVDLPELLAMGDTIPVEVLGGGFVAAVLSGLASIYLIRLITAKRKLTIFAVYLLFFGCFVLGYGGYTQFFV